MISKYGLFYTFSKDIDTLEVLFSDDAIIRSEKGNDVEIFYGRSGVVKANIYGIKKYVKIRISGLIYLPSDEFIALVNGYLGSYGILLSCKDHTGFVIEKNGNKYFVIAKKGTLLPDKNFTKEEINLIINLLKTK